MIENLHKMNFINYKTNKQTKGAKLCASIRTWREKKSPKHFRRIWKTEYEKSNYIWIIYWW